MPSGVLLVASDDSDVPDLDLPDPRRKRIFNKRTISQHVTGISPTSSPLFYTLSLLFLTISVVGLGIFSFRISKKYERLNIVVAELTLLPSRLASIESDLHRLRMEFDLTRDTDTPRNQTGQTVQYVRDSLSRLDSDVLEIKKNFRKIQTASSDVTHRISTVEEKCLNVCRLAGQNVREKQRRRVSDSEKTGDEIVFKRIDN